MRLVWSRTARQHLREAREFIAQDSPDAADALVALIASRAGTLERFPQAGRPVAPGLRSFALPPTPFRLVYRVLADRVLILAVWHGARRWP